MESDCPPPRPDQRQQDREPLQPPQSGLEAAADADRRALLALHRRCMRCPAWILSEHAGHRMCEACREDGDDTVYEAAGAEPRRGYVGRAGSGRRVGGVDRLAERAVP